MWDLFITVVIIILFIWGLRRIDEGFNSEGDVPACQSWGLTRPLPPKDTALYYQQHSRYPWGSWWIP